MIKKSVDDAILDAILAKAFEEAAARDLAELETNTDACPAYPEEFRKIERRRYNKVKRSSATHKMRTGLTHTMKRVVSFVLIIGFVSFCVMLSAPTIRAEFVGMITKFFDKYFSITLPSNTTPYEAKNYIFSYIPQDYTLTQINETSIASTYIFTSENKDRYFTIYIRQGNIVKAQYDNEHTTIQEISINNYIAYATENLIDYSCEIIWTDSVFLYSVSGNIPLSELINISENIINKNPN